MADSKFYLFAHSSKYSRQASSLSSLSRLSSSLILCYGHANDMREEVRRGVGGTSATHPGIITPVSCSFLLPAPPLDDVSPSFSLSLSLYLFLTLALARWTNINIAILFR